MSYTQSYYHGPESECLLYNDPIMWLWMKNREQNKQTCEIAAASEMDHRTNSSL